MRLTITPIGGGQPYVLGDDAAARQFLARPNMLNGLAGYIDVLSQSYSTLVQKTNLVRAATPFGAARLNQAQTYRFKVTRSFASFFDCQTFVDTMPTLMPLQGEIQKTTAIGSVFYLPIAFRENIDCTISGCRCDVTYSFWAPSFWRNQP